MSSFYTKIKVHGPDAEKFLQGQLTCDVGKANTDKPLLAAHCNPKGRIVSLFFLMREDAGFGLFLPQDLCSITLMNLRKYGQFFKTVTLEESSLPDSTSPPFDFLKKTRVDFIEAGLPLIYAETSGLFLPHDINLPQLEGVSFDKGCYTGQEIIARMQNLGKPKQHLYRLSFETNSNESIFKPGTKIYLPERLDSEIGYIVDAARKDNHILALASLKDAILTQDLPDLNINCLNHRLGSLTGLH